MDTEETSGGLVTIARFPFPYQAHLLAGKLESEGIIAFIANENQISISPWMANALGGVQVQVRADDVQDANAILKTIQDTVTPDENLPKEIRVNEKPYDLVNGICPECGIASIYLDRADNIRSLSAGVVVLTLQILVKVPHRYYCLNCQYTWNG